MLTQCCGAMDLLVQRFSSRIKNHSLLLINEIKLLFKYFLLWKMLKRIQIFNPDQTRLPLDQLFKFEVTDIDFRFSMLL